MINFKKRIGVITLLLVGLIGVTIFADATLWRCRDHATGWNGEDICFIGECEADELTMVQPCVMECISGGIREFIGCEFNI